ncbi:hypothetical protein Thal_0605 [Thermocrinis albus DSM 14484]|uniref:Uncharacterized protein n=1 Tax=Thermocrinis albus (strain DSM 14484 / JCM 11386 / HI 11/12) TaxID=638303 RepID=D3SQ02_THEAH|nr:hypothetical protein [Thermocrinis albus]ADC89239.1 hypothetical protein Thal_0605 [Thermocrinis albus DSM 14484]
MWEELLLKEKLTPKEKLAFFRGLLKHEMEVLNQYCAQGELPRKFRVELCHLHNIKKVNIARLLEVIEQYDPDFIKVLAVTDPRVRTFLGYYFEFLKTNPYGYEALEPQNLFGNWDFIKYKLRILFPELSIEEIDRFKFKRREFIEYVKSKLGESEEVIESKLNKATWYETVPYLELEEEMNPQWHPEPIMTDEDWAFIKRHIRGRKNIFIRGEDGKEKLVYVEVDLSDEELDQYRKDREGLKRLLMERYRIDESGAEQILRKAGWESETYHIIPPIHTDVVVDYGELPKEKEKVAQKEDQVSYHTLANVVRKLGGMELEILNYYDLIYEKVEDPVRYILDQIIRTQRRILGKLFGIYYTVDPLMAEAILTINPERLSFLQGLAAKITVRDKEYSLYSNSTAWKIVKRRITSRFPEVTEEEIEGFKGQRGRFVEYLSQKTGKSKETIDRALSDCGWTPTEEIPAFLRQIGP